MERCVAGNTGIVDHDVNRTELFFDLRQTFRNGIIICNVELVAIDPELFGAFVGGLLVAGEIGRNLIALVF